MFSIKTHRLQIEGVFDAFTAITQKQVPADKALTNVMRKNKMWEDRERQWVSDTLYDLIRRWRLFGTLAETGMHTDKASLWRLLGVYLIWKGERIGHDPVFEGLDDVRIKERLNRYKKIPALFHSVTDWLETYGSEQLGEAWEKTITALNKKGPLFLRVNRLQTTPENLVKHLRAEGFKVTPVEGTEETLRITGGNIFRSAAFETGWFEVQDMVSQQVAPFLEVEAGMRVIDACAGAGGKTLQLAALMQNRGRLLALDTAAGKLEELKRRSRRAGVAIVETRVVDSSKVVKRLHNSADRLLLDVPCSGSGVLRRNPDIRWWLDQDETERLIAIQEQLLEQYSKMVKPGGKMVYAVCSIFPAEGEKQVAKFLEHNPEWICEAEKRTGLIDNDGDGFYFARLMRKSG